MTFPFTNSRTLNTNKNDGGQTTTTGRVVASEWNDSAGALTDVASAEQNGRDYVYLKDMTGATPTVAASGKAKLYNLAGNTYVTQGADANSSPRRLFWDRNLSEFGALSSNSANAATNDATIAAAMTWAYTELNTNLRQPRIIVPIMDIPISATIVPKGNGALAPEIVGAATGRSRNAGAPKFQWYGSSGGTMLQTEAFNSGVLRNLNFDARSLAKFGVNISATTFADPTVLSAASGWRLESCRVANLKKNTVGSAAFSWGTDPALTGGPTYQSSEGSFFSCDVNGEQVLNGTDITNMKAAGYKNMSGGNAKNTSFYDCNATNCDKMYDLTTDSGYTNIFGGTAGECRYVVFHNDSQLTLIGMDQECDSTLGQAYTLKGGTSGSGSAMIRGCQFFVNAGAAATILDYSSALDLAGNTFSNSANTFWLVVNVTSSANGSVRSWGNEFRSAGRATYAPFKDGSANDLAPVAGVYGGSNSLNITSKGDYDTNGGSLIKYRDFDSATSTLFQATFNAANTYAGKTGLTAHAGGGQASATALTGQINFVTTVASGNDSSKLPTGALGLPVTVFNKGANAMDIYPQTGGQIDALGANNPYSLASGTSKTFYGQSATQWYSG